MFLSSGELDRDSKWNRWSVDEYGLDEYI
jgi:hypothetical protein